VRTHPPPPEMGGGRAVYRRLPDRGSDLKTKSNRRLIHRNSGRQIIFGASRIVAVRYALTREQWIWLRWLASAQGGWV
jgi:hypothetical protein